MPFVDVKLADVELEKPQPLPDGDYVFQLNPGAEYRNNKFTGVEELNVSATVVEGESQGRVAFFKYPDPTHIGKDGKPWAFSAQAMKKLEIALGVDANPGEDSADYFNRVATNYPARFSGKVAPGKTYKDKNTGEDVSKSEFQIFSVGPAA